MKGANMCRYISLFWRESPNLEITVGCLYSHGVTEKWLGQRYLDTWQEGHYLPDGSVELRDANHVTGAHAETLLKERFPTFLEFEKWALAESAKYYDCDGFDRGGFDRNGFTRYGFDRDGFDHNGFDYNGVDREGIKQIHAIL
jgi:hypothetical protein